MENNLTLKTYMAVMAERDAAIRERNVAIEERRQALAERDVAMTQRDSALAERNTALEERDTALNALQFRESPTNEYNPNPDSQELDYMYNHHQQQQQQQHLDDTPLSDEPYTTKTKKGKQTKEKGGTRSKKKGTKRGSEEMINNQVTNESTSDIWDSVDFGDDGDDLEQHFAAWNQNPTTTTTTSTTTGLKEEGGGGYDDESTLPVPVCSCSGVRQPCYKLGNGGWQSTCCSTTMLMYHLHQPNKRQAAGVVGRKISESAFAKLMNRVVAEGHDPFVPLDLKDHWDQHETPK